MAKGFASTGDTAEKKISFDEIGRNLYAFTAEGDPNSGIIIGDDSVMVVDAQATPVMALEVIERVRKVTDKPIKYVLLSHYHAVRVLGASAYPDAEILASDSTRDLIVERGQQDKDSEIGLPGPPLGSRFDTVPAPRMVPAPSGRVFAAWAIRVGKSKVMSIEHIGLPNGLPLMKLKSGRSTLAPSQALPSSSGVTATGV